MKSIRSTSSLLLVMGVAAQALSVTYLHQTGDFRNAYGCDATGNTVFHDHQYTFTNGGAGIYDIKSLGNISPFTGQVTSGFNSVLGQTAIIASSSMVYNGHLDNPSATPDTTVRTFQARFDWSVIFSWNGGQVGLWEPGSVFGTWTSATLESGSWNGSSWTSGTQVADILNLPGGSQSLTVAAGEYRVTGVYDVSFTADAAFSRGNSMTVYLAETAVPEPATMAVLLTGAAAVLRRRARRNA